MLNYGLIKPQVQTGCMGLANKNTPMTGPKQKAVDWCTMRLRRTGRLSVDNASRCRPPVYLRTQAPQPLAAISDRTKDTRFKRLAKPSRAALAVQLLTWASRTRRLGRSTKVPTAERLPLPLMKSPSQCPGVVRVSTSLGRWPMGIALIRLLRAWPRARGMRLGRAWRRAAMSSVRSAL